MIKDGLEYAYLTTGLGLVQLWVPFDDPGTLYYDLSEPNSDAGVDAGDSEGPKTEIEKVLCLCLMGFDSSPRDQTWRNAAQRLPIWTTNFHHTRSQILAVESPRKSQDSNDDSSECVSSERTSSEYQPTSSPAESSVSQGRRVPTRSLAGCAPSDDVYREDNSDSDADPTTFAGRKRGFSQITSSTPTQRSAPTTRPNPQRTQGGQSRSHDNEFCTQQCLLGLRQGGTLDARCPNVELHQSGSHGHRHPISMEELVQMVKQQLDENLDRDCTPMGGCGSYGAPFKVTCAAYGYTVVGKGTTSRLWKEVSREAEFYHVLLHAQGSAVPVFLGKIDLTQVYFLHGAGEIRHMLLMGWAGHSLDRMKHNENIQRAISQSEKEIRSLGVFHQDLRPENILWNPELKRALIIDLHRCTLDHRPTHRRLQSLKGLLSGTEHWETKRVSVV